MLNHFRRQTVSVVFETVSVLRNIHWSSSKCRKALLTKKD
nr:MAG TPA: hypothetical protein [Caudoviricetes sp.]